jgi:lipoprotein-anchoring transpeptidase ErfK/SrfK
MASPLRIAPIIVTIDRERFRLTLWKMKRNRFVRKHRWEIAVGAVGHDTPAGMYFVSGKSRTPDWLAPDSDWVPVEMRGKVFPIDNPHNPFEGGFISLGGSDGVGIHGVKFDPQLGTRASHGCIRMATDSFLRIYDALPMGTPVFIY